MDLARLLVRRVERLEHCCEDHKSKIRELEGMIAQRPVVTTLPIRTGLPQRVSDHSVLAITIPFAADAMDKRYRHFRTIFAGLGLVIEDFDELNPYNKDGRELVMVRFNVRIETAEDNEHRSRYRLDDQTFEERRADAEAILDRTNAYAVAKAEYDAANPTSRGDFMLKPLEIVYDSQDHYWKVYKFAPTMLRVQPQLLPTIQTRSRPNFRGGRKTRNKKAK